ACDVCFVGGSLVQKGGQNFVEPFFFGKPVITGSDLSNFLDVLPVFEPFMTIVENPRELAFAVETFPSEPAGFEKRAGEGQARLEGEKQALDCVMEALT
ncbi:MAG: 3-deoxy-D-manno-octulosonic acid transferase, partial [Holophagae bacterium]|nr:3-deoxy-D-manno-octulosonic acid transferase [Holophagae bacterium]